jgi:hypothetical protein
MLARPANGDHPTVAALIETVIHSWLEVSPAR